MGLQEPGAAVALPFLPSSDLLDHKMVKMNCPGKKEFGLLLFLICQVTLQTRLLGKQLEECCYQRPAAVGRGGWGRLGPSPSVA